MFEKNKNLLFLYFAFIFISLGLDIYEEYFDWQKDGFIYHFAFELVILFVTFSMMTYLLSMHLVEKKEFQRVQKHQMEIENSIDVLRARIKNIRTDYLRMIDQQFDNWQFTAMEKELGLLILKGYSFDDIAKARQVTDKTARKQAVSIYAKANVKNRNEFSAWFFEELI